MKFFNLNLASFLLALTLLICSCENNEEFNDASVEEFTPLLINSEIETQIHHYDNQGPYEYSFLGKRTSGFTEGYESATKFTYATTNVDLSSSGIWRFSNAKIGSNSRDRKFGRKAARLRREGYIVMNFNMDEGVQTIRVRHAKYGNDGNSSWRLVASYDDGATWSFVGETINTTSTMLNTVSFEVNETRSVRYGISKRSGGDNRINFDNFEIITNGTGGGDGGNNGRDSNLTFGNPSNADLSPDNYFLMRPEYTLSYNSNNGTPNWVSWHLSEAWLGEESRCNCFMQDISLPDFFFSPTENDYSGSGFQRGHICPSADRDATAQENANTYFMTNIAPQAIGNNLGPWAAFERYLRSLVDNGNEVHIVAGITGTGGTGTRGYKEKINDGKINVPDSFWKVALILPNGTNDINRVTTATRIIAVNMPNDQGISFNWRNFRTTVDDIENLTGYDFFENIPDNIETILESRVDNRSLN